jgi:glyoxylase-like metal-dependent hydrolase (beta-lactamase superfamily II)
LSSGDGIEERDLVPAEASATPEGPFSSSMGSGIDRSASKLYICLGTTFFSMPIHKLAGRMSDSNVYLVMGSEPTLIDTGTGMQHERLLKEISRYVRPAEIRSIILTHCHFDHIGGVPSLLEVMDANVYAHAKDATAIAEADGETTAALAFGRRLRRISVNPLEDGDEIMVGDARMRVVHTPGHTVGSMCLHDSGAGILFSGDTFFVGGVGRWDLPTGSHSSLLRSLKRLEGLDFKDLYPGHGEICLGLGKEELIAAQSYAGD